MWKGCLKSSIWWFRVHMLNAHTPEHTCTLFTHICTLHAHACIYTCVYSYSFSFSSPFFLSPFPDPCFPGCPSQGQKYKYSSHLMSCTQNKVRSPNGWIVSAEPRITLRCPSYPHFTDPSPSGGTRASNAITGFLICYGFSGVRENLEETITFHIAEPISLLPCNKYQPSSFPSLRLDPPF